MDLVLGIDAAWTATEPSGVALLRAEGSGWRVVAVASSYSAFAGLARGEVVDWQSKPRGSPPDVDEILDCACSLGGGEIRVVAIDMPLAKVAFDTRRVADREISRAFGGRGCGAHSPTKDRPGQLAHDLMSRLADRGLPLATDRDEVSAGPSTIEVYPHPALLTLLSVDYRVPYKVSRSTRYWRGESVRARIDLLLAEFGRIHAALADELGPLGFELPQSPEVVGTLAALKRYEDALDAVVCAWIGTLALAGSASAYGDSTASIWAPD